MTIYTASASLAALAAACLPTSNIMAATTRTVCAAGCQFTTIQSAIDAAEKDDTILIEKGRYVENLNTEGKRITLQGADRRTAIIDGNGLGPVITIPGPAPVSISDVTITRGYGAGGGILVTDLAGHEANSGGLNLRHSIIIANHSTTDGGGISVNAVFILPTVTISDCTIANNSAAGRGGGFAMLADGPVTISKSTFADNQATEGGGIYVDDDFYLVHVTETTLVANTAATDGGGMWFDGFGGHLEVDDNVVAANNSAGHGAGGIFAINDPDEKPPTVVNNHALIYNNPPDQFCLGNCAAPPAEAPPSGGK